MKSSINVMALILERVKTQVVLAKELNVSPQAIGKWFKRGKIPSERVLEVEKITGVSRHVLRPDLYPEDSEAA